MAIDKKDIENLQDELGALQSIASDVGKSLRDAFKDPAVNELKKNVLSTLSAFNKTDKSLGNISVTLDKVLKKEISKKDLAKEINKLAGLESKIQQDIRKVRQANNLNTQEERDLQNKLLDELQSQLDIVTEQKQKVETLTKSYKGQKGVVDSLKDNWEKITDSFSRAAMQLFVWKAILDAALTFNKISTSIGKNLGYSASQSDRVTNNIVNAARGSENLNFTLKNAGEAVNDLNSALGGVAEYSTDA